MGTLQKKQKYSANDLRIYHRKMASQINFCYKCLVSKLNSR